MCLVCLCVAAGVHTKDIPADILKTLQPTLVIEGALIVCFSELHHNQIAKIV